jgi:hypothetical protein
MTLIQFPSSLSCSVYMLLYLPNKPTVAFGLDGWGSTLFASSSSVSRFARTWRLQAEESVTGDE